MITNTGKLILGKYLIGQTPAYASYIAVGCGADPRSAISFAPTYKEQTTTTATLTFSTHDFKKDDSVLVSGCGSPFDGTFTITAVTGTTISYTVPTGSVSNTAVSGGSVTFDFSNKKTLDFEMFRVPIISRSFINEDGVSKVVFSGELPTTNRYEMTEIGVYSSGSNSLIANADSKSLMLFSENVENWEYHSSDTVSKITQPYLSSVVQYTIQDGSTGNIISNLDNGYSFFSSASDSIFDYKDLLDDRTNRLETKERPRFYDSYLAVRGNTSSVGIASSVSSIAYATNAITVTTSTPHNLTTGDLVRISGADPEEYNVLNVEVLSVPNTTAFTVASADYGSYVSGGIVEVVQSGTHIHNSSFRLNLSNNSSDDELKLSFSLMKVQPQTNNGIAAATGNQPDNVYVTVEFATDETESEYSEFARMEVKLTTADIDAAKDSLYFVATQKLSQIITTEAFSWSNVRIAKIYVCVEESNAPSPNYYVALDGMRLESVSGIDNNPLYGMIAYSTISNSALIGSYSYGKPTTKKPNTNNLIEFKFAIGVS